MLLPLSPANIIDAESVADIKDLEPADRLSKLGQFLLVPVIAGAVAGFLGKDSIDYGALLAAVAVYTGLLFNLLFSVFDKSISMRRDPFAPTNRFELALVDRLYANVNWSVFEGIVLVSLLSLPLLFDSPSVLASKIFMAMTTTTMVHLVLMSTKILRRFSALRDTLKP